jgi:hypothetical protein
MHRRRYLTLLGATALAGCGGNSSDGSDENTSPTAPPTDGASPTEGASTPAASPTDTPSDSSTGTESPTETAETPSDVTAAVGELVAGEQMHLVVEGVNRGVSGGEFLTPESGNEYVQVALALKNVSDEYLTVSNLLQTRLRDDEDYQYSQTIIGGDQPTFNDGQFAPGEVERGAVTFEIPESASGLTLVFDFDVSIFGGVDRATIDLELSASSIHQLEQSLAIDVYEPSDSVAFEGVETAVNSVQTTDSLGQFTEPSEGNEFVIVDIAITNETGEEQRFSTVLQMMLKDGQGYTYQENLMATASLDRAFDEGTPLTDGETRRGELAYEVPTGTSPLYWVFEFQLFANGDKTFWQLR